MNGTMVTLVGHVVSEVKYATTVGGVPVASFRLAATDRRFDRQRQIWVDGDTSFFTVWSWRWLAENVLSSVGRGDPLLVTGRMRVREWDNGEGRAVGVAAEIEATAIGHDLSRGTSAFRRAVRGRPELVARAVPRSVGNQGADNQAGGTALMVTAKAETQVEMPTQAAAPGSSPASVRAVDAGEPVVPVLAGAPAGRRGDGGTGAGENGGADSGAVAAPTAERVR
ncbi:single-strand DNA-binding protein [Streptacidiphilus sp. MAP12-16]|uniref:single-stranded DNA-binding protein n=1 Tax=Streptacidiphilus sp. MAP12-16 TaxID=3156300 RepID=UPI00351590FC